MRMDSQGVLSDQLTEKERNQICLRMVLHDTSAPTRGEWLHDNPGQHSVSQSGSGKSSPQAEVQAHLWWSALAALRDNQR